MGSLSCIAWNVVYYILQAFLIAMFVYALLSWIPSLQGRWTQVIARIVEPVLTPLRRVIPPVGGIDLSFIVVGALLIYVIMPAVHRMTYFCGSY